MVLAHLGHRFYLETRNKLHWKTLPHAYWFPLFRKSKTFQDENPKVPFLIDCNQRLLSFYNWHMMTPLYWQSKLSEWVIYFLSTLFEYYKRQTKNLMSSCSMFNNAVIVKKRGRTSFYDQPDSALSLNNSEKVIFGACQNLGQEMKWLASSENQIVFDVYLQLL